MPSAFHTLLHIKQRVSCTYTFHILLWTLNLILQTVHWEAHAEVAGMLVLRLTEEHLCLRTVSRNHFSMATTLAKWAIPFICLLQQDPNQFLFLRASSLKSSLHRTARMIFEKHKSIYITSLSCFKSCKGFLHTVLLWPIKPYLTGPSRPSNLISFQSPLIH